MQLYNCLSRCCASRVKIRAFDNITPQRNKLIAVFGCVGLGLSCIMIDTAAGNFQQIKALSMGIVWR